MAPRPQNPSNPNSGTTTTTVPSVNPNDYITNNPITTTGTTYGTEGSTGVAPGYIPPPRSGVTGKDNYSGIIDSKGNELPYYNLSTEPRQLLAGMQDEVKRNAFLKNLYERGWYGSGKPGGGLSDDDEKAVFRLLYSSNLTGVSWDQIYSLGKKSPFAEAPTADARFRVSSTEDLIEIANRTALSTIGRKLSVDEASRFSRAYQSSQQSEAAGGAAAPSTDVFFKNRIEQKYGAESDGYKYLSAISNVARLMENM
jgi:hypothetical protein